MPAIHLHQTTTSTPEQYVAGLTNFGPGRSKLFGNSADEYLKVHSRGPAQADAGQTVGTTCEGVGVAGRASPCVGVGRREDDAVGSDQS